MSSIMPNWEPVVLHYGDGGTMLLRDPATLMTMFNAQAMSINDTGDLTLLVPDSEEDGTMAWVDVAELTLPKTPRRN